MGHPDWLGQIINPNIKIKQITLPGSHDAGVSLEYNSGKHLPGSFMKERYICQEFGIAKQLYAGARFFDIRFGKKDDEPTTYHAKIGGWGESARSIFLAIANHLGSYPREFVILRITHTDSDTASEVHAMLMQSYASLCHPLHGSLAQQTLKELRGKLVVSYDRSAVKIPLPRAGLNRFAKYSEASDRDSWDGVVTCGSYPGGTDITKIGKETARQAVAHLKHCIQRPNQDHLFMLYWQMTGGNVQHNTKLNNVQAGPAQGLIPHSGTHGNLDFLLKWLKGNKHMGSACLPASADRYRWMPNIISMDFLNDTTCGKIIDFTRQNLTDGGLWLHAPSG